MIKFSVLRSTIFLATIFLFINYGCKKENDTTPNPNAIPANSIRIIATINAQGIQPDDTFRVVGNFKRSNHYNIAGIYIMNKQPDGTYRMDVPRSDVVDGIDDPANRFGFYISRNGQYEELNSNCEPVNAGREIWIPHFLGKEYKITVEAFRGTGSCPP